MVRHFWEGEECWVAVGDVLVLGMARGGARAKIYRQLRSVWCIRRGGELWCPAWQLLEVLRPEDFLRYSLLVSALQSCCDPPR